MTEIKGQIHFHILIKITNRFVCILACCRKDIRLLRKADITKFLYMKWLDKGGEIAMASRSLSFIL